MPSVESRAALVTGHNSPDEISSGAEGRERMVEGVFRVTRKPVRAIGSRDRR